VAAQRYRILSLVGEGGFGRVYRARLETDDGFTKDVAIKVLADSNPKKGLLERFRDEARILGLLRDRAIVSADPPIRIGGRWAVVMDFVDGVSLATLLQHGPLPPSVAFEIVGEVARALDNAYYMEGPGGKPLQLLHRDIKPENIQLTPAGEVKILDFGIAKADFENREHHTIKGFGGTIGYIAPERTVGTETPAGDVFSLGVTLHETMSCARPVVAPTVRVRQDQHRLEFAPTPELDLLPDNLSKPGYLDGVALAAWMRADNYQNRPTAREVEDWCRRMRQRIDGPSLRDWSEAHVPHRNELPQDGMVGTMLTRPDSEGGAQITFDGFVGGESPSGSIAGTADSSRTVALGAALGTGITLALVLVLLAAGGAGAFAYLYGSGKLGPEAEVAVKPPDPSLSGVATAPSLVAPPIVKEPPAPVTAASAPGNRRVVTVGEPGVRSPEPTAPVPEPMRGLPEAPGPQSRRPAGTLVVTSIPTGATVLIDGKPQTGVNGRYTVAHGDHMLVLRSGTEETKPVPIHIVANREVPFCWNFDTNKGCAN
jgi:serine/threonine protein kinase